MKLEIHPNTYFSLANVITKEVDIVKVIITTNIHLENTLHTQVAHSLYPNMLLSGCGKYSREAFLDAVNMLGASIDVQVNDGRVSFTLRSTTAKFGKLLKLFEIMIQNPTFQLKDLKRVKSTSLNQLHQAKEDSKNIALDQLRNEFYGASDRKYTYSIEESMEAVPSISVSQLKKVHARVMANKWFCTIGGGPTVVKKFQSELKKIKKDVQTLESVHQPKPPNGSLVLKNIPSRQNIDWSIGIPLPITRSHPDFIPLTFAVAILGKWGGFAGRLMNTVREKEGLTYGIYGQLEGFASEEQGYFRIMTFFAPDKATQGLTSTFREIKKLFKSGVSQAEVDAFKTILTTQQSLVKDSFSRMLADLHSYHCEGFTIAEMEEQKNALQEVTKSDINAVIKTYLEPNQMSVSGAGPTQNVQKELNDWFKSV